ncbi:GGDEF domain-containing protein [Fusobacterium ulcerans]|uniref:Bacteriophytochrome cph2 n=1 Tax=Fusobacterium ulcerans TaxID=861 RepID=A0AAX2J8P4_9FUSO|nr:GGDEF domain-containing protein [Fusobacterium ulcerans]AVQ28473.1 GGDEF domain-containing protein [Fusobacterium ulcerans]EFS25940.1 hypothetical protein FUAG_01455 [Fusobacterium ulcerans ATCC 49185]SQJ00312.1 Bacteriophytochrome cph2 [Fusobacterium ulcerans]
MKKLKLKKKKIIASVIFFNIIIGIFVIVLMRYVQNLLYLDVNIHLSEVLNQNKEVITNKLKLEINNLNFISYLINEEIIKEETKNNEEINDDTIKNIFLKYYKSKNNKDVYFANKKGEAIFINKVIDITGRNYFKLSIQGINNISERIISRDNGEDMFVISVPIKYKRKIIGTVQKKFTPEEMYNICSVPLFSSKGNTYIINSQGYILVTSNYEKYNRETDNYFRMLYSEGNKEKSEQLKRSIKENKSGFIEIEGSKEDFYLTYTPIKEVYGWYLISTISTEIISRNGNTVVKIFYFILFIIIFVFLFSGLYFLDYKNKQQIQLENIAFIDNVTKGDSYNKFIVDLSQILLNNPEKKYHILKFDIKKFKYINSFYGFEFGNKVLTDIYKNNKEKLTTNERIARISADNFVILLEELSIERLNDILEPLNYDEGATIYFSGGLYSINDIFENVNLMVDKANIAANSVKEIMNKTLGFYSEEFNTQILKNEKLKKLIREAIDKKELMPYYQPKVNIHTNELVGAEALARWKTKEGKLISPFEFIPICEKTGMIVELDMIIFEKVLKFLKSNLDKRIECTPISVNFSKLHINDKNFFKNIMDKLDKYNIPTSLIEIEMTETVIFDNYKLIKNFIRELHKVRLMISMDDFGTGYSSLNMLKDIPIDILKIDKGFLDKGSNLQRRNIIFSAIVDLAQKLGIKVVVEGVETIENIELMKNSGCYIAQGYYYAKPMDEEEFQKIYEEGVVC